MIPIRTSSLRLLTVIVTAALAATGVSECYEFDIEGDGVVCFEIAFGHGRARMGAAIDPVVPCADAIAAVAQSVSVTMPNALANATT